MRIVLTLFAVALLALPWLKLIGSVLLLWIGVKLLLPEAEGAETSRRATTSGRAIKTILIADLVMSLDNVIAVAAAAGGSIALLIIGLAISHPARDLRRHAAAQADGALARSSSPSARPCSASSRARWPGRTSAIAGVHQPVPAASRSTSSRLAGAVFVVGLGRILAGRSLRQSAAEHLEHMERIRTTVRAAGLGPLGTAGPRTTGRARHKSQAVPITYPRRHP